MAYKNRKDALESMRRWRLKNVESERAKSRAYYAANRDKMLERARAKQPEQRARSRARKLPAPTRPEPDFCELCGKASTISLCLDHDHVTNKFRGWLCHICNTGLGKLGDSIESLERALAYLKRAQ